MLANPREHPISVREAINKILHEVIFVNLGLLTASACGNKRGIARIRLAMMYGFRPCSNGNGHRKNVGNARPRKHPVFP